MGIGVSQVTFLKAEADCYDVPQAHVLSCWQIETAIPCYSIMVIINEKLVLTDFDDHEICYRGHDSEKLFPTHVTGLNSQDMRKTNCLRRPMRSPESETCEFAENKNALSRARMLVWRDTHEETSLWFWYIKIPWKNKYVKRYRPLFARDVSLSRIRKRIAVYFRR